MIRLQRFVITVSTICVVACGSTGGEGVPDARSVNADARVGGQWSLQTVDTNGFAAGTTSIAVDSAGRPHIAYLDATDDDLKYARYDGQAWQLQTVDTEGVGWHCSLELDANDVAHISHYSPTDGDLRYSTNGSGAFVTTVVDSAGAVGRKTSLALDSEGRPHISYHDTSQDDLKYAVLGPAGWVVQRVDTSGKVGDFTALVVDADDQPHIAYNMILSQDATMAGDLRYAQRVAGTWVKTDVDIAGVVGHYNAITIDHNGMPHISYRDDSNADLKHAYRNDVGWQTEVVASDGDLGDYNTSIASDAGGVTYITFHDVTTGVLKYARRAPSGGWEITVVDDEPFCGHYSSLAFDSAGNAHISYSCRDDVSFPGQATYIVLRYARRTAD